MKFLPVGIKVCNCGSVMPCILKLCEIMVTVYQYSHRDGAAAEAAKSSRFTAQSSADVLS